MYPQPIVGREIAIADGAGGLYVNGHNLYFTSMLDAENSHGPQPRISLRDIASFDIPALCQDIFPDLYNQSDIPDNIHNLSRIAC